MLPKSTIAVVVPAAFITCAFCAHKWVHPSIVTVPPLLSFPHTGPHLGGRKISSTSLELGFYQIGYGKHFMYALVDRKITCLAEAQKMWNNFHLNASSWYKFHLSYSLQRCTRCSQNICIIFLKLVKHHESFRALHPSLKKPASLLKTALVSQYENHNFQLVEAQCLKCELFGHAEKLGITIAINAIFPTSLD